MTATINVKAAEGTCRLPAVLDLASAADFHQMIRSRSDAGGRLRLDASAVEAITYSCIQIILSALKEPDRVSIENPSDAFLAAFRDLGLDVPYSLVASDAEPDPVEVADAVSEAIPEQACQSDPQQWSESPMAKRILTIDDSKTMRDMLMLTLGSAGFDVLQAVDGEDGLDVLYREQVDVVITDINMPKMDGYEVIRQMRGNPDYRTIPILVLTTESEADKKNRAREAGATGWMVKPFDPERLVATIYKVAP